MYVYIITTSKIEIDFLFPNSNLSLISSIHPEKIISHTSVLKVPSNKNEQIYLPITLLYFFSFIYYASFGEDNTLQKNE